MCYLCDQYDKLIAACERATRDPSQPLTFEELQAIRDRLEADKGAHIDAQAEGSFD